jgi:hypothetical protein
MTNQYTNYNLDNHSLNMATFEEEIKNSNMDAYKWFINGSVFKKYLKF